MAIRLRTINGKVHALCAAKSKAKTGDIYLDDAMHTALGDKFALDYNTTYGLSIPINFPRRIS